PGLATHARVEFASMDLHRAAPLDLAAPPDELQRPRELSGRLVRLVRCQPVAERVEDGRGDVPGILEIRAARTAAHLAVEALRGHAESRCNAIATIERRELNQLASDEGGDGEVAGHRLGAREPTAALARSAWPWAASPRAC